MHSATIKKLLALFVLILAQWAVLAHAKPQTVKHRHEIETESSTYFEPPSENPWLKSQINGQNQDYLNSVNIGNGSAGNSTSDPSSTLYMQNGSHD